MYRQNRDQDCTYQKVDMICVICIIQGQHYSGVIMWGWPHPMRLALFCKAVFILWGRQDIVRLASFSLHLSENIDFFIAQLKLSLRPLVARSRTLCQPSTGVVSVAYSAFGIFVHAVLLEYLCIECSFLYYAWNSPFKVYEYSAPGVFVHAVLLVYLCIQWSRYICACNTSCLLVHIMLLVYLYHQCSWCTC